MTTPYGPRDGSHDDQLAARLRDALTSEADMVKPSDDGLQNIRAGIDESGRRPWWRHPATPALAAALVLGLMAGGIAVIAGGGDDEVTVGPAGSGSSSTAPTVEDTPTPAESPTATTPPRGSATRVFVYFMQDDGTGVRLYREEHQVDKGSEDATAAAALRAMFEQPPIDRDYISVWPLGTEVLGYSVSGDVAAVDLTDAPAGCACIQDEAVQQLVYTVTANDPAVKRVRLRVDGKVLESKDNDWSQPVSRAPMLDVQGLIWLLTPTEGATVSSPVDFTGYGTAFEATISWQLRQDGKVVDEGTVMGGSNGEFGEFSGTIDGVPPGTYELRAFESSAKDGSPQHVDTKTFTVAPSPT